MAVKTQRTEMAGAAKLIGALNHPLRRAIDRADRTGGFAERTRQRARRRAVADQLPRQGLRDLGLIELQHTKPRRGAVETTTAPLPGRCSTIPNGQSLTRPPRPLSGGTSCN